MNLKKLKQIIVRWRHCVEQRDRHTANLTRALVEEQRKSRQLQERLDTMVRAFVERPDHDLVRLHVEVSPRAALDWPPIWADAVKQLGNQLEVMIQQGKVPRPDFDGFYRRYPHLKPE